MLSELLLGGPAEPWQRLGFTVTDGSFVVAGIRFRLVDQAPGLHGWGLASDAPVPSHVDGVPTHAAELPPDAGDTPLGIVGWDHLVLNTNSLDRTCAAIEVATGAPLKRVRDVGAIRQGFHRLGPIILEVVESARVTSSSASLWGFVWNVADLDLVCDLLGPDVIAPPKVAVQPGRQIASFREGAGLGLPVALMTPPPPRVAS